MNRKSIPNIVLALLLAGSASMTPAADPIPSRGPMPFEAYDTDGDGSISQQEFDTIRADRIQSRSEEGRPMRNLGNAPGFADIDTDGDGRLSREELQRHHQERMEMRLEKRQQNQPSGMGSGKGMGPGSGTMN